MVPKDCRDAIIIPLSKGKDNRELCRNSSNIALLSAADKILCFVLLLRLNQSIAYNILPEFQCHFHLHRGTANMIFTACQIQEKCYE